jgi:nucleotide-binding universal stress UspA family protein
MTTVPLILAAVDGSDQSLQTITYLSQILSPADVGVELFHVLSDAPEPLFDLGELEEAAAFEPQIGQWKAGRSLQIDRFMEAARQRFLEAGFPAANITASVQSRKSGIARDILAKSRLGYAAVAIGRNGFGAMPAFMLGSIAAKLADTVAHVPLAIVGGRPETRNLFVAFDRSRGIRSGFSQVGPLLSRALEQILLCHIVRPLSGPAPARESYFSRRNEAHWLDENSRRIIPALVEAKQFLSRAGFDPKSFRTAIIKEKTSRAEGLCAESAALGAGTIVVGRRGATTVEAFAMGRVTRKILHLAFDKAIWIV